MFLAGWTRPGCRNGELTQQMGRLERGRAAILLAPEPSNQDALGSRYMAVPPKGWLLNTAYPLPLFQVGGKLIPSAETWPKRTASPSTLL